MVIKDITDSKTKVELFIEEQNVNNKIYRVDRVYAPNSGIDSPIIRISISEVFENNDANHYKKVHGIDLCNDEIRSYEFFDDKNDSTHENRLLDDKLAYYDEIINGFDELINSGKSEFTDRSIALISEVKKAKIKKRVI